MNILGFQHSVRPTADAVIFSTGLQQRRRVCELPSAVNTSFGGRRLASGKILVQSAQKRRQRFYPRIKIFAVAQPQTQTADSDVNGDHNGALEKSTTSDEQHATEWKKFNWNKQWYPIMVTNDLDKDAPHAVTIIGRPLAVWWDKEGSKWQVYADRCPHRLAPLSEGSISEEGHLRCSYHGWTFKGDSGKCTRIPQAPSAGPSSNSHASKRACVTVYPSMEQQGILWFWPDLSQGHVNVEAAANPPPVFPELSDPSFAFDLSFRDLEYSYETLIENLMDPSHVQFAHHKIQGNRAAAKPLNFKVTSKIRPTGYSGEGESGPALFHAPCSFSLIINIASKYKEGQIAPGERSGNMFMSFVAQLLQKLTPKEAATKEKKVGLIFMCIPVSPGRSRVIWSFPRNFATPLLTYMPKWIIHKTNNLVLDSDMYLLHLLDRRLEHEGANNWFQRAYVPATADAFVIGFRTWLRDIAGGAPDWAGRFENRLPPSLPRQFILDSYSNLMWKTNLTLSVCCIIVPVKEPSGQPMVYSSSRYYTHVAKCKGCSSALRKFRALEVGFQVLAIALVGLVATSAVVPIRSIQPFGVPLVAGAVISTLLSRWLAHFIYKTFYFHDYNHAAVK